MSLRNILQEKKPAIVKQWFEALVETYPEGTRSSLRKQDAQFANPVGYHYAEGVEALFDALLGGMLPDTVSTFLDSMIRIRAVQNFTPAQAVRFIFQLKQIVRAALGSELLQDRKLSEELVTLESAVDDLALFAFDLYMHCREGIYDIKAKEAGRATFRLLQQAKIITGFQE
jgi:hypothetical protein